ncbi:MAG: RNA polymerase sigma factor [Polyangiaceae bacterium]
MSAPTAHAVLDGVYRAESRRVLATLVRLLGGFDAAEEALADAFAAAAEQWPRDGTPENPYAWLVSAGRFKTLSRWRRRARIDGALREVADAQPLDAPAWEEAPELIRDDELRLFFTCCHPALHEDARVALTLREVGGLTTEEIARAYLVPASTIAQRIVRAKAKIRDERIPYEVPGRAALPARIESVLSVVYLVFNEGYAATRGPSLLREALTRDALRLGRRLVELLEDPEALGLLALMLIHQARARARVDGAGELVLLEHQDRALWDRPMIEEALGLIDRAIAARRVGPYLLQSAIAAVHATAPTEAETNWAEIVGLYDVLYRIDRSPVVALNRAVAIGRRDGWHAGLAAIEAAMRASAGELDGYHLAHAARADVQRRLGLRVAAIASYERALTLAQHPVERRFLERRLGELR